MSEIILSGVVGLAAYGLASSHDRVERTALSLNTSADHVTADRHIAIYELGTAVQRGLAGDPDVLELMWLPEYDLITDVGRGLVALRDAFLCAPNVRARYLDLAARFLRQLEDTSGCHTRDQHRAHVLGCGRQLARVMHQASQLYLTGQLPVRLDPHTAQWCRDLAHQLWTKTPALAHQLMARYERSFDQRVSVLPEHPDSKTIDDWFGLVRITMTVQPTVTVYAETSRHQAGGGFRTFSRIQQTDTFGSA